MKTVNILATTLLIVGGINWGLVGLAQFDLVATLLGEMSMASRAVYTLVGLSAVYLAFRWLSQPADAPLAARAR
jgi:uncharacterized membrane protein YuzA (DUF378 family)